MHKDFYVGGFLIHPDSEQILLQQLNSNSDQSSPWFLFGGITDNQDNPDKVFKNVIHSLLDIKIETVFPIYSYSGDNNGKSKFIFYSEIQDKKNFPSKNNLSFEWFTFKEITKLKASVQTKHDIVVGQRVIEAATRKKLGLHTF